MENVKIKSTKGNLSAVVCYPEIKTDKLAILCPGYLNSKDYQDMVGLAEMLSGQGYTVVRFDPTGTWESEGSISSYETSQYLVDIKNVLEFMLQRADFKHIMLAGHSRGGQVAIVYASRDPRISLVLGIMPSTGGPIKELRRAAWEKSGLEVSYRDLPANSLEKIKYSVPYSHAQDAGKYCALDEIDKIKVPIILIAGEIDEFVLPDSVKNLFEKANQPKRFAVIPGVGHNYRQSSEEVAIVNNEVLKQINNIYQEGK